MDNQHPKSHPSGHEGRQSGIRTVYNMSMGLLWTFMGLLFLAHDRFGIELNADPLLASIFGGACILYGSFRLWRGIRGMRQ